jgi:hypothetical protein
MKREIEEKGVVPDSRAGFRKGKEPGKVCEKEKAGSECWEEENGKIERDRDTDKQKRRERIRKSRYNREYETEDVPVYLEREKNDGEIQKMVRMKR